LELWHGRLSAARLVDHGSESLDRPGLGLKTHERPKYSLPHLVPIREHLYRKSEGFKNPGGENPNYSQDELARLVVFATAVLRDAESIERDAQAIQQAGLDLYYEQGPDVDWDTRNALVKAWHREKASDGDA
jgi:hypothetical protein